MLTEKQLEELLKASVEARRAEFGKTPTMPNPMRAKLQAEIARSHAPGEPQQPRRSLLFAWWPRLAIGAAVGLLLVGVPLWWMSNRETRRPADLTFQPAATFQKPSQDKDATHHEFYDSSQAKKEPAAVGGSLAMTKDAAPTITQQPALEERLAKNRTSAEITPSDELKADKAPTLQPQSAAKPAESSQNATVELATPSIASRAEVPTTSPPTGGVADAFTAHTAAAQPFSAPAAAAPLASPSKTSEAAKSKTISAAMTALNQNEAQNRSRQQNFRASAKSKPQPDVLNNFQVEQTGNDIKFVDSDGSTYSGQIVSASRQAAQTRETSSNGVQRRASSSTVAPKKEPAPSQVNNSEFQFRAIGSNRSLKKPVVFEGRYIVMPQQQKQTRDAQRFKTAANRMDVRIIGRAKIGNQEIEVDAVSAQDQ